ncbi:MAG TPA: beta-galactosidase [Candidatus Sulfopaludibacter sp.]|nr:beta-galactosidase [Candidatus Sulfopaludibacter sp.]
MKCVSRSFLLCLAASAGMAVSFPLEAAPLTMDVAVPRPVETGYFKLGSNRSPDGREITVDNRSLRLDGRPWFPVMGEFHYSRYPADDWRAELLKMKAGGVDVVSTYVFWIHHEEIEGQWDWSGRRDLRKFVQTCGDVGLKVLVRCGPWDHGEVRNGGFPDWVVAHKDWELHSTDTNFLAATGALYGQIASQLRGMLWKDGGPVIGIQLDNEYSGPAAYLMALKKIARSAGLDVPFYTETGWPGTSTPIPRGEVLPLYGVYADGFWDRDLAAMGGDKWMNFTFSTGQNDTQYPYLCCEIGGGMETSYHRRILVDPRDIESVVLVQLGDGSSLLGYYMYQGGQNPEGKLTTLNESQATGYLNDMPVKNYDFQAALGEYGQLRPQYHWLRRLHLFLHDFGKALAEMPASFPDLRPTNRNDLGTLRWSVRSDGNSGYVFVNNYQRLQPIPPKKDAQFQLNLPGGKFVFPAPPVTIPANESFFWPFNLDVGSGVKLAYATAQPVCKIDDGDIRTMFFAQAPGVPADFVFDAGAHFFVARSGKTSLSDGKFFVCDAKPGHDAAIRVKTESGRQLQIVLLGNTDSLALWKGFWLGRERVFLTQAGLVLDGGTLSLSSPEPEDLSVGIFPAPKTIRSGEREIPGKPDGLFGRFQPVAPRPVSPAVKVKLVHPAGPARIVPLGKEQYPVALAPDDADFTNAAVWAIKLPAELDLRLHPLLRIHYVGDVARVTLNGKLLDDNFYNGRVFDLGLTRYAPEILQGDLRLEILPLRKDAPIYLAAEARPDFGKADSIVKLARVEIVYRYETEFTATAH